MDLAMILMVSIAEPALLAEMTPPGSIQAAATTVVAPPAQPAPIFDPNMVTEEDAEKVESHMEVLASRRPIDPLHKLNAVSFAVAQSVDDALLGQIAHSYEHVVPEPVRDGVRNFLNNLQSPVIFSNFVLQHKFGKACETAGRFVLNSTIGVFGLFDIGKRKPFGWPRRRNGFANTLGFYGVKPGPYLFLPLVGPTTLRDLAGGLLDGAVLPTVAGAPFDRPAYYIPTAVTRVLDRRDLLDEELAEIRKAPDPYVARRLAYLARRSAEIEALHTPR